MKPKEKAKQLVYKYQSLVNFWHCYNGRTLEMIYRLADMKQCALIAVDELIYETQFEVPNIRQKYWLEVKQEIEKL